MGNGNSFVRGLPRVDRHWDDRVLAIFHATFGWTCLGCLLSLVYRKRRLRPNGKCTTGRRR